MGGFDTTQFTDDDLYESVAYAETGHESNPFIRTRVRPKGGSTAFGPVQITRTRLLDAIENKRLTPESRLFALKVLLPTLDKFAQYGAEPKKPGYRLEYDYGGTGMFDPKAYGEAYRKLGKEMLTDALLASGGDIDKTITNWRGVSDDKRYNGAVKKTLAGRIKANKLGGGNAVQK